MFFQLDCKCQSGKVLIMISFSYITIGWSSLSSLYILNSVYFIANLAGKGKIPENQAWIKKKKKHWKFEKICDMNLHLNFTFDIFKEKKKVGDRAIDIDRERVKHLQHNSCLCWVKESAPHSHAPVGWRCCLRSEELAFLLFFTPKFAPEL